MVATGSAPKQIVASHVAKGTVDKNARSPFPLVAKYKGAA
jgi:hypothetical protein